MQIYLLGKKIKTVVITKSLSKTEIDMYKSTLYKKPIKITFGFSQNINHYGIMMYHRNRLIKPYVRVGYQTKVGLICEKLTKSTWFLSSIDSVSRIEPFHGVLRVWFPPSWGHIPHLAFSFQLGSHRSPSSTT